MKCPTTGDRYKVWGPKAKGNYNSWAFITYKNVQFGVTIGIEWSVFFAFGIILDLFTMFAFGIILDLFTKMHLA
jgi:hypothetical protein